MKHKWTLPGERFEYLVDLHVYHLSQSSSREVDGCAAAPILLTFVSK